jgi:hypothetical protein
VSRTLRSILIALVVASSGVRGRAQSSGPPLRLLLECSRGSELTFKFTLENISPASTAVVIGTVLGNDRLYLLENLTLAVKRESGVFDPLLRYFDPATPPAIAGRMDPWLVTLPQGSSYSIAFPAKRFIAGPTYPPETFSTRAQVQLYLSTRDFSDLNLYVQGFRPLNNLWVGRLSSNWLAIPQSCGSVER